MAQGSQVELNFQMLGWGFDLFATFSKTIWVKFVIKQAYILPQILHISKEQGAGTTSHLFLGWYATKGPLANVLGSFANSDDARKLKHTEIAARKLRMVQALGEHKSSSQAQNTTTVKPLKAKL